MRRRESRQSQDLRELDAFIEPSAAESETSCSDGRDASPDRPEASVLKGQTSKGAAVLQGCGSPTCHTMLLVDLISRISRSTMSSVWPEELWSSASAACARGPPHTAGSRA